MRACDENGRMPLGSGYGSVIVKGLCRFTLTARQLVWMLGGMRLNMHLPYEINTSIYHLKAENTPVQPLGQRARSQYRFSLLSVVTG